MEPCLVGACPLVGPSPSFSWRYLLLLCVVGGGHVAPSVGGTALFVNFVHSRGYGGEALNSVLRRR